MDLSPEMVAEEMATPPEYKEVQQLDANYALLRRTVRQALAAEEEGANSEDIDMTIGQAIEDSAQNQLDIFDLDVDIEMEPESSGDAATDLGAALSEILDESYNDPEEGIAEMAAVAEMAPEQLMACISGQMVPTPASIEAIANHYLADDEEAYQGFMLLGQEAYQGAVASGEPPEPVEMNAVNDLRAEFNAIREREEVGTRMRYLEKLADGLLAQEILTPAEHSSLLRSDAFRQDPDSVALFSNFCYNNGTTPHDYLNCVEFCLNWKQQCGPSNYSAFFNQMAVEPIDTTHEVVQESQQFVQDYRSRHGYQ